MYKYKSNALLIHKLIILHMPDVTVYLHPYEKKKSFIIVKSVHIIGNIGNACIIMAKKY